MDIQKKNVVIVGGGVSGLALAGILYAAGGKPQVYEASPRLTSLGGGILVAPNSVRVLEELGLTGLVQVHGVPLERMDIFDSSGKLLYSRLQSDVAHMYGGRSLLGMARSELHRALAELLPEGTVHPGMRLMSLTNNYDRAEAHFSGNHNVQADLLVGADGRNSTVRAMLYPESHLVATGEVAYRGITNYVPSELDNAFTEFWGPGRRFMCFRMNDQMMYWQAPVRQPDYLSGGPLLSKQDLQHTFRHFPGAVQSLIEATDSHDINPFPISDISPLPEWWSRRTVLVGDAAHATSPNLGQGAAQALEDVASLARHLQSSDTRAAALEAYQKEREETANAQTSLSRQFGRIGRAGGVGRFLRNAALSVNPDLARQRIEAFYGPQN